MIVTVTENNIVQAAMIHSVSWQASHKAFCSPEFVQMHTPERQLKYLRQKINSGTSLYLLIEEVPLGIVSVTNNTIEDLYVLPEYQNKGYGTKLITFAVKSCTAPPHLWILETNNAAKRLYQRLGFIPTGRIAQGNKLKEIEYVYI